MAISENLVASALPTATGEGRNVYQRSDAYGNSYSKSLGKRSANIAASSGYFVFRNATNGTGLDTDADATAVDDTEAFIHLYNNAASGSGVVYALDYIKIKVVTPGTNGTTTGFFTKVYRGSSRYSANASLTGTGTNCRADSTVTASMDCHAGPITLSAANGTERLLSAENIRSVIAVAGDHYWFDFGADQMSAHNGLVVSGTAISNLVVPCAPVVIGPQSGFQFGLYGASQSVAANYEFEVGFYSI
jgi:hypothetical protein